MSAEAADVLDKAAERIERTGWIQQRLTGPGSMDDCAVCALGAIYWADGGYPAVSRDAGLDARRALLRLIEFPATVGDWNDAPGRTQAEVVAKLREAAAIERAA